MPYVTTTPLQIARPPERVFAALCDLKSYPLWNNGMQSISEAGPMREGQHFHTESIVMGRVNRAEVTVVRLTPNREIELRSQTGLVSYQAVFSLAAVAGGTQVTCGLQFELRGLILDLGRPVIESMAKSRVQADLQTLQLLLEAERN